MAPELSRLVRHTTFLLLALAAAAVEVAASESRPLAGSLGAAAVWVALAAGLSRLVPDPAGGERVPPRRVLAALAALLLAPLLVEPAQRHLTGDGRPLEIQMTLALRNLGLGLAACAAWPLCQRLACVVSLFLMLFAASLTDHRAVLVLLGLYSAAGSVWLMLVYWTGLRQLFAAPSGPAVVLRPGRERLPWPALALVLALVGSALALAAVGPRRAARVLGEWLPTSGGTGGYDPFARGGVNDGDDEVKGANARSTGMTLSDTFLDSPLPSLYDLFNDQYGEPFKPTENERAVALDPGAQTLESRRAPADNLRPNREFPTARHSPKAPRDPGDRAARALFEVAGRTPLHVRVTAFDRFDGAAWQEAPLRVNTCLLEREGDGYWLAVRERPPPDVFAVAESHQFKVATPFGSLVPAPPHLQRFRIGRVNQVELFTWGQDRVLRMVRQVPSGITVETEARTVDPRRLPGIAFPVGPSGTREDYLEVPEGHRAALAELAGRWGAGHPAGWARIDAVVQRLRAEYAHDPAARAPAGCRDPLAHFLLESRRGPDYQFAGAAALLVRALGHPTRVVSGFYVAPEKYDPLSRHTPVVAEDLHFWAEVLLPSGDWLILEPTPGYETLGPNYPLSERLGEYCRAALLWCRAHALALGAGLALAALAGWRRRELLDALGMALWHGLPCRSWQQRVYRTLRLLERRGRWAGRPRPAARTVAGWLPPAPAVDPEAARFVRMAEWAAYAPGLAPPWDAAVVRDSCGRALRAWTLRRWQASPSES